MLRRTTLLASLLLGPTLALAQSGAPSPDVSTAAEDDPPGRMTREMEGHTFIPSALVIDPFTDSFVGTSAGWGVARFRGPLFDDAGAVIGHATQGVSAYSNAFRVQAGFSDFFAVRGHIDGTFFAGRDMKTELAFGTSTQLAAGGGATLGGLIDSHMRIGLTFDVDWGMRDALSPTSTAAGVRPYFTRHQGTRVMPGLAAAIALHPALGITVSGQYVRAYGDLTNMMNTPNAVLASGAIDFDLLPIANLPLGLLGAYRATFYPGSGVAMEHDVLGGVFFTGSRHVVFGAQVDYHRFQLPQDDGGLIKLGLWLGEVVLRYYF